jgi:hypothetical protein
MINSHEQQQREYCCEFMDGEMQGEENQEEEGENLGFIEEDGFMCCMSGGVTGCQSELHQG